MSIEEFLRSYGSLVISSLAFWLSYRGYRIARRSEKRAIASTKPIVAADVLAQGQENWFQLDLTIENRASHGYRGEHIFFFDPTGTVGLSYFDSVDHVDFAHEIKDPLPIEAASQTVALNLQIAKAGVVGRPYPHSIDEKGRATFFFHVKPGFLRQRVHLRVRLMSIEGVEKKEDFIVSRKLPGRIWYRR